MNPKNPVPKRLARRDKGFALVITLSLMILLVVVAVALLSLSTISLRTMSGESAAGVARANARMAVMLALGDLQKTMGDDRRVTADGSVFQSAKHTNTVGVWKGWSPKAVNTPTVRNPSYSTAKTKDLTPDDLKNPNVSGFAGWLVSSNNPKDLTANGWAQSGTLQDDIPLFTPDTDGFESRAGRVSIQKGKGGTLAWTIAQDATRAKINVGGPERGEYLPNDMLQAQARPSLEKSDHFSQPDADWNKRATRVVSLNQSKLDDDLWKGSTMNAPVYADFTSQGFGLLTDPVNGGLKADMTLGFEMSDADFREDRWNNIKNPFRAVSVSRNVSTEYEGQRPMFSPLTNTGSVQVDISFNPASTAVDYPAAAVPTFDTLRSFYRTPFHMYSTGDGPTIFERGMDNVALTRSNRGKPIPGLTPPGTESKTGFRPVLDRVLYLISVGVVSGEPGIVFTPVVTLWNPYNVALDIEGAVVYSWMDMPFNVNWTFRDSATGNITTQFGAALSQIAGYENMAPPTNHGRSVNPYFYAAIVPSAATVAGGNNTIRFKPGEVRVFAPKYPTRDIAYKNEGTVSERTVWMSPVDSISQLPARAGMVMRTYNTAYGTGTRKRMTLNETAQVSITPITGSDYPFSIGFEDATRARQSTGLTEGTQGLLTADIQTINFIDSASGVIDRLDSPAYSYTALSQISLRTPFGMIETYHRVASDTQASRRSDLVYTTNPRQPFVNRYLTTGTFLAGPHYETRVRKISSFNEAIQTDDNGRTSFYGLNNSSAGSTRLAFFEAPQQPLLSIAGFQHADLAGTCYSTANQVGNSWASAYLPRYNAATLSATTSGGSGAATFRRGSMPVYDYAYLANEELWDSFFFSGASSVLTPGSVTRPSTAWNSAQATVKTAFTKTLEDFIDDPEGRPLRNTRMRLHTGTKTVDDLKQELTKPEGCVKIASHLKVDGAFNVNSTSLKAWIALLSGLRGQDFSVREGSPPANSQTAMSRFRDPMGDDSNNWQGFRSLSDTEIEKLAGNIVNEVRLRGPFLSLGEFVNRRLDTSEMSLKGAIQAAIDKSDLNGDAQYDAFSTAGYPADGRANISPSRTGVGIPGYLTQADVLQAIGPVLTTRSDTFTIRGYGEAKDQAGKVQAVAWCEAVVQREPEFVDPSDAPETEMNSLKTVNQTFGRRFSIVSFRYMTNNEVVLPPNS